MDLDLSLGRPADLAHSIDLTTSSLTVSLALSAGTRTYLFIPAVFGLEGDSGVERKDETDGVSLALQALEDGTEERAWVLGLIVSRFGES
jgi:hypothetical protein